MTYTFSFVSESTVDLVDLVLPLDRDETSRDPARTMT
jgi:hypothetical protein